MVKSMGSSGGRLCFNSGSTMNLLAVLPLCTIYNHLKHSVSSSGGKKRSKTICLIGLLSGLDEKIHKDHRAPGTE